MKKVSTGALLDTRLSEDKNKDYLHEEVAAGVPQIDWEEKQSFKEYFPYDQYTSLSCVAGGGAITEEHFANTEGVSFVPSRKDIYIRRFNRPAGGMAMHDLFNICIKGIASESQVGSQKLSEIPMNAEYPITAEIITTRSKHNFKNWVSIANYKDIDTLASIVDHTPIVCFWFFDDEKQYDEHWRQFPQVVNDSLDLFGVDTLRHQVTLVDRTLINGKKYFVGQDTAGLGTGAGEHRNLRFYSEEFIKARLYSAGYGINNLTPVEVDRPHVHIDETLTVGARGGEVIELQKVLIFEKLLPIKSPTGYFGGLTLKAVKDYQKKYADAILKPLGLKQPTGIVGSATKTHINNLYA